MINKRTLYLVLAVLFITISFCAQATYLKPALNYKKAIEWEALPLPTATQSVCTGTSITIAGENAAPAGTFLWQVLSTSNNWVSAPGPNNSADYTTTNLTSNSNAPRVYNFRRRIITNTVTTYDSFNDITVNPKTAITNNLIAAPPTSAFCVNGNPDAITGDAATGGDGVNYNYQWQQSVNGGSVFTDIGGATTQDYDPPVLTGTTIYRRVATSGICNPPSVSNKVTITILTAISRNEIYNPATIFFCTRADYVYINGNTPSGGTTTFRYQWQSSVDGVNFIDIPPSNTSPTDYGALQANQTMYYRRAATSGPCLVPSLSNVITITVQPGLSNNSIIAPAVTAFCTSGNPDIITGKLPYGGNGTYNYQWQSSPDGGIFKNIPGAISQDFDPPLLTANTYYQRTVTSGACATPLVSNQVFISVSSSAAVTNNTINSPAVITFCTAVKLGPITGSAPTGGNGVYTYVWQSSVNGSAFADIPNSNVQSYDPQTITQTTIYKRGVTSGACNAPAYSNQVTITIQTAITGNAITPPQTTVLCANSNPGVITGAPVAGGNGISYNYQWQLSTNGGSAFTDIAGANSIDYDPPALTVSSIYRRVVSSGSCNAPSVSNRVSITIVNALTNNHLFDPATTFYCIRSTPTIINGNIPSGGNGTVNYQWQNSTNGTDFNDILGGSGTGGNDYNVPILTQTTYYRRLATSGACTVPIYSNVITIAIQPGLSNNSIVVPSVTTFCTTGDPAVITASLPTGGTGVYSYQWQNSTDGGTFTNITGALGKDYDPPVLTATMYYQRIVTSGACTTPLVSNQVLIAITPPITANTITSPASTTFCTTGIPGSIPGSIPAGGNGIYTFTWQSSVNGGLFTDIPNSNVQNFDPQVVTQTTVYKRGVSSGGCSTIYSNPLTININPAPAAPVLATNPVSTCKGAAGVLAIDNPIATYTYNWYSTPTAATPVFTGPNFTTPPVNSNVTYYVEAVNNSTGCTSLSPRTVVNVSPILLPTIIVQGVDVCPGETATLTTNNTDNNINIKWYTTATGATPVFTGNSFTTLPVNANTTYYAEVTNNTCVAATRLIANVQLIQQLPAPVVIVETTAGTSITFSWVSVTDATGYEVSIDGGQTFTIPSSGSNGTTHMVTGLPGGKSITLIVRATGNVSCMLSNNSAPVTGSTGTAPTTQIDQIFVANTFTPNNDGKNDIVYVHNENIKSLKFYVYDQWGDLLYLSQNQQNGWDGTFKGKKEPSGVYVYYVDAIMSNGTQMTKKGTITLLR